MMKGTTLKKFTEIAEFVQRHHKFARWVKQDRVEEAKNAGIAPEIATHGLNIKYVRMNYDTRFGDVWSITFDRITFATNSFVNINLLKKGDELHPLTEKYQTLEDLCYAYLKGELQEYDLSKFTN